MGASYYTQVNDLNLLLRGIAWSPADYYGAISTTQWNPDGTGGTEPATADGYSRQHITSWLPVATMAHPSHAGRTVAYSKVTNDLVFGPQTANWGFSLTRFWAVFDNATRGAGNLLWSGSMGDASGSYGTGRTITIPASSIYLWYSDYQSSGGSVGSLGAYWLAPLMKNFTGEAALSAPTPYAGFVVAGGVENPATNTYTEVTGGSYARQSVSTLFNAPVSSLGVSRTTSNANLTFTFTATGVNYHPWIWDASTGGQVIFARLQGHIVSSGDTAQLDTGSLALEMQ